MTAAPTNLFNVFVALGARFGDSPALEDSQRRISFGELPGLASQTARALEAGGFRPGDHVGIALRDGLQGFLTMIALWALGATAIHIDFRSRPGERETLAHEFDLAGIVEDRADPNAAYRSITVDAAWEKLVETQSADSMAPRLESGPALIALTSGTTGRPTGIVTTHEALLLRFMMHMQEGFLGRGKRYLCAIPLAYSASRNHTLMRLLDGGSAYFMPPLFTSKDLAETLISKKRNAIFMVPTILRGLLDLAGDRPDALFPDMELLFLAGAFTSPHEKLLARKVITPNIYEIYSSTLSGNIAILHGPDFDAHSDTVGRVMPHARVEIVDDNDGLLPRGVSGHIRVCAPGMQKAIYDEQSRDAGDRIRDGWAYPGDFGLIDEHGFLKIVGRASEVIIRGGANVHPSEIEAVVSRIPGVKECAVVGYEVVREGEDIAVFIVADGEVSEGDVLAFCRSQLSPDKRPRRVIFVKEFPRNNNGKVLRRELSRMVADG